ncbi:MotA/TolQ/ExbB proton channel family protein [Malikia sp.]|uniref:MotA/TolQ/ExbB proton channel family protein n=1 Tax=Malikia sp. TaxID=2070706 RepID=UPI00262A0272|nr:MotA/TolQ/ExbB proton channel family protein [Malikia sp.]MDD2728462.1 MotA/TolQ/ExbB proton channel family protein [Malikia sp.]
MLSILEAAGWPIWPLLACSVLGLALALERFISLRASRVAPPGVLEEALLVAARAGLPAPEVLRQFEDHSVLGAVLVSGWRALQRHPGASEAELRSALESAGRLAAARLHQNLTALGTIASAAPLLGLLGTVIGMIEIFGSQSGTAGLTPGGGDPTQLAHGISIALYNTAFGLLVAIPALVCWRHLRALADAHLLQLEIATERFAQQLCAQRR